MTIAPPSECLRHHGDGTGSPVRFVPGLEGSRLSKQCTSYMPVFNYPQEAPGSLRRVPRGRRDTIEMPSSSWRWQGSSLKSVPGLKESMLRKQCGSYASASSELCIQCVRFNGSALKVCSVRGVHRLVPPRPSRHHRNCFVIMATSRVPLCGKCTRSLYYCTASDALDKLELR